MALLELEQLHTYFKTRRGMVKAVNGVSFSVEAGKTLGLVGESGSGKSVCATSILKLLPGNGQIHSGVIRFNGRDLASLSTDELYQVRGNDIAMIFQEPMTSLNPVFTVGAQLREAFSVHQRLRGAQANQRVLELLSRVQIPDPQRVARQYPHQLSGGMCQRVVIAMALSCQPRLLIADEPTTALDVTIQAQILHLLNELKRQNGTAILFITHDMGVIRRMCDDVAVLYCGQVVEQSPVATLFGSARYMHPYTRGLLRSIPRLDTPVGARLESIPGTAPHPLDLPPGCLFAPRCKFRTERCVREEPSLVPVEDGHLIRCFYPESGEEI